MKKKQLVIKVADPTKMIVDGKTFRAKRIKSKVLDHHRHEDEIVFEEIDEKKFNEDVDFIVENIEQIIDKKAMLREIIKPLETEQIEKIRKLIERGEKIKVTKGCYGITIGNDSKGVNIVLT